MKACLEGYILPLIPSFLSHFASQLPWGKKLCSTTMAPCSMLWCFYLATGWKAIESAEHELKRLKIWSKIKLSSFKLIFLHSFFTTMENWLTHPCPAHTLGKVEGKNVHSPKAFPSLSLCISIGWVDWTGSSLNNLFTRNILSISPKSFIRPCRWKLHYWRCTPWNPSFIQIKSIKTQILLGNINIRLIFLKEHPTFK
jgi:hypothetical protein